MDQHQNDQNEHNNQQIQSQNQKTSKQRYFLYLKFKSIRSENVLADQQQFKEKKNQSESNIAHKQQAKPQSMETSIQRQYDIEPNNPNNEQGHQGILDQQDFKVEGKNLDLIRSNQTTLTTLPQNIKNQIELIDNEKASKLLQQYQEDQENDLEDLISEIKKEDQHQQQLENIESQYSYSESESQQKQKFQIILSDDEIPQEPNNRRTRKSQIRRSLIKLEDAQFIDQKGVPIDKLDIFKQQGSVLYNPHYKFFKQAEQQKSIPVQIKSDEPKSSIILTAIYPIVDIISENNIYEQREKESDKQRDQESDKEIGKESDKDIEQNFNYAEEEVGRQLLRQRRQKELTFLEPEIQTRDEQPQQREIKKLSKEELSQHSKQKFDREAIQYKRNQKMKEYLRKQNGTDNIPEETIEEKCQRLTQKFEAKLQILPSDDIVTQIKYLKKDSKFKSTHMNAMDQQRAIWLKHGFVGHLKPKIGFRFDQLYEKTDEYLIDEDDPYGIKGPFIPQPEDRIKFERLYQQQLKDSSSLAYKTYVQMLAYGGKTTQQNTNNLFQSNNSFQQQQQQNNPFLNNQFQNNLFQNNTSNNLVQNNPSNNMFSNNPSNNMFQNNQQNNMFQNNPPNNLFQNNPIQNNLFQPNTANPFQNNLQQSIQQSSQQNNPFLNLYQSTGNKTNMNQQPVQNIFGQNNSVANLFSQQGRQTNVPQTFKQSQSPMRYRVNSYQNNINQQANWNKNSSSAFQNPIKDIPNIFQPNNQQGQTQQPTKLAYNPFQPQPITNQLNNVNKPPDIFQPQSNINIPPLQNIFSQHPPQNVPNQGTNRYNTRSNNRVNNYR